MKILYIASIRIPSVKASGLAIVRQCVAMANIGHDVLLLIPNRHNVIKDDIFSYYQVKNNIKIEYYRTLDVMRFWSQGFYLARLVEIFSSIIQVFKNRTTSDVIYSRDQWMLLLPVLFGFGQRSILEIHTKHTNWVIKYVVKRVKKIVVISKGLQDFYQDMSGRTDILLEPSGVDLEQFKNLPNVAEIKKNLKIPTNKIVFGYVGKYSTMGESKGVDEIIQAFGSFYKKYPNTHLLIVGLEKDEFSLVLDLAYKFSLPIEALSLFELEQTKFAEYVAAADILLMNYPNTEHYAYYMSPTKLFAYLASGQVIISSDLPSIRTIANDEYINFVEPDDINKYAEVMIKTLANLDDFNSAYFVDKRKQLAKKFEWPERAKRILN